ncbi:hypothetical protein [Flyfo myovirus Tbat2_7]|nr:hypothetical protein [Flyfo myovirus Tbat2_7]
MFGDFMILYIQLFKRFSYHLSQQFCIHKYMLVSKSRTLYRYDCKKCGRVKLIESKKRLDMGIYAIRTTAKTYYWKSGDMIRLNSLTPTLYTKITDAKRDLKDVQDYYGTDLTDVNNYPKIVEYLEESK